MTREFTPEMGEISGFGGSYEAACRTMLLAGLDWLDAHPEADPKYKGYSNVFGLMMDDNEYAKQLDKAIIEAAEALGASPTGAMHHAVISHILFIRKNGWDAYVAKMSEPDDEPVNAPAAEPLQPKPYKPLLSPRWFGLPEKIGLLLVLLVLMFGFVLPALISAPSTPLAVFGFVLLAGTLYTIFKVVQHIYKGTKS